VVTVATLTAAPTAASTLEVDVSLPGVTAPSNEGISWQNNGSVGAFNTRSGVVLICSGLHAEGTINVDDNQPATGIGSVASLTFNGCTINGLPLQITPMNMPWRMDVTGATSSGVAPAKLVGVKLHMYWPSFGCQMYLEAPSGADGEITGEYHDPASPGAAGKFHIPYLSSINNLSLNDLSGACAKSLFARGDSFQFFFVADLRGNSATNNEGPTLLSKLVP
jgi:hypothetical protein